MNTYTKCATCPTQLRYDALQYTCDSCSESVCPKCAGTTDTDDPMPKCLCEVCAKEAS